MKASSRAAAVLALALSLAAPYAFAETEAGVDAKTEQAVTEAMTAQGYEVRKIVLEDGKIEVYAVKDGETFELKLDAAYNIVATGED